MRHFVSVLSMFLIISFMFVSCQKNELGETEEGLGGEVGESGQLWNRGSTASEIVNGIKLILTYDAANESFKGTLENLNTKVAPQVRVEVHVYDAAGNSAEYGPTAPADMQAGEKRNVTLAAPGAGNFVTFAMHPEVGGSDSGEGTGGGEGSEGNHNENGKG